MMDSTNTRIQRLSRCSLGLHVSALDSTRDVPSRVFPHAPGWFVTHTCCLLCFRKKEKANLTISLFEFLVELRGIEPLTPRLPALCSPS